MFSGAGAWLPMGGPASGKRETFSGEIVDEDASASEDGSIITSDAGDRVSKMKVLWQRVALTSMLRREEGVVLIYSKPDKKLDAYRNSYISSLTRLCPLANFHSDAKSLTRCGLLQTSVCLARGWPPVAFIQQSLKGPGSR